MHWNIMSIGGIPSEQNPSLSYWPTGQGQIVDNGSLDRYPFLSKNKRSKIFGAKMHV